MEHQNRVTGALAVVLLLAGCSGGGESTNTQTTGPFSLQVIDAPVDSTLINRVCVAFSAVTVHYADGSEVRLDYEPLESQISPATHCTERLSDASVTPVRLDALSGNLTVNLVDSVPIPTGRVTWIRLHFTAGSYVVETNNGGMHPLTCPSCEVTDNNQERGFKLNRNFEVPGTGLSLIADIDLRKSLHYTIRRNTNERDYILRPTARVERSDLQGAIAGDVQALVILSLEGSLYQPGDEDTGCFVYVFPDGVSELEDFYNGGSNVVTTAAVRYTGEPPLDGYVYAARALPVEPDGSDKSYRVAMTCDLDDPDLADESDVEFFIPPPLPPPAPQPPEPTNVVTVSAGQTSEFLFWGLVL